MVAQCVVRMLEFIVEAAAPSSVRETESAREAFWSNTLAQLRPAIAGWLRRAHCSADEIPDLIAIVIADAVDHESALRSGRDPWAIVHPLLKQRWRVRTCEARHCDAVRQRPWEFMAADGQHSDVFSDGAISADASLLRDVARAMRTLSASQRRVVRLRVIDELSFEVIAHRMGIAQSTARQHLFRGLNRLRASLRELKDRVRDSP